MRINLSLFLLAVSVLCSVAQRVDRVFGFPSLEPGYSLGVSACYAGRIGQWLVMAGGCNFTSPGNKTYYSGIYAARADRDVLAWRLVGWLPQPAAYGVTVQSGDSLLFVGGCNGGGPLASVYSVRLDRRGEEAVVEAVDSLPCAVDNMAGAVCGGWVYVVGGNHDGHPSAGVLRRQLAPGGAWSRVADMPGVPRVQPVCAAYDGRVYVWGGFWAAADSSVVSADGCCYDVARGSWAPLAAPRNVDGAEATLSGGVGCVVGHEAVFLGGVCRDIFLDAISGRYELVSKDSYLLQPVEWYRFNSSMFVFDFDRQRWLPKPYSDRMLARAGAQAVAWGDTIFYIGGELKPAVRTPQICVLSR